MDTFLALVGMFISVVLIGIILLQRGRGGGLVGALSGLGGQSAFGTKAGDTFTRITIGIAAVWVILAGVHGHVLRSNIDDKTSGLPDRIEIPLKDKEPSTSSTKSSGSKTGSGLGPLIGDEADDVGKDEDPKKKSKTIQPATDDTSEDLKKPESNTKPEDAKDESKEKTKPKEEAKPNEDTKPRDEAKKDDELK